MQAKHVCNMSYRHACAAFCRGLSQSVGQPGMPIQPGHELQVTPTSGAVQAIERQIKDHRLAKHGEISNAPPDPFMNMATGTTAYTTGQLRLVR